MGRTTVSGTAIHKCCSATQGSKLQRFVGHCQRAVLPWDIRLTSPIVSPEPLLALQNRNAVTAHILAWCQSYDWRQISLHELFLKELYCCYILFCCIECLAVLRSFYSLVV